MTDSTDKPPRDYDSGYCKPPERWQFEKGRSGNPRGRPPKKKTGLDALGLLEEPVNVREGGQTKSMPPKEIALRQLLKKALTANDDPALFHLIDEFEKHGVFAAPIAARAGGVVALRSDMPFEMAYIMATRFGRGPWTEAQLAQGRAAYRAKCSPDQAKIDEAIAYPALLKKDPS